MPPERAISSASSDDFALGTFYQDDEQPTVNPRDAMLHSESSMVHYQVPPRRPSPVRPRGCPRPPKPMLQTVEEVRQSSPAPNPPERTASDPTPKIPQQPIHQMHTQPARKPLPKVQKRVEATPKSKTRIAKTKAAGAQSKPSAANQKTATASRPVRRTSSVLQRFQEYLHKGKWYEVQGVAEEDTWAEEVRFATGPPRAGRQAVPTLVLD